MGRRMAKTLRREDLLALENLESDGVDWSRFGLTETELEERERLRVEEKEKAEKAQARAEEATRRTEAIAQAAAEAAVKAVAEQSVAVEPIRAVAKPKRTWWAIRSRILWIISVVLGLLACFAVSIWLQNPGYGLYELADAVVKSLQHIWATITSVFSR